MSETRQGYIEIFEIMQNVFKDTQHWPFHGLSKTAPSERIMDLEIKETIRHC